MALSHLTERERDIVHRCVAAAAHGPFFPDWEFWALFGLQRGEVADVASNWANLDDSQANVSCAIGNSLNNLLGYPHNQPESFERWIGETWEEVQRIHKKWRASNRT